MGERFEDPVHEINNTCRSDLNLKNTVVCHGMLIVNDDLTDGMTPKTSPGITISQYICFDLNYTLCDRVF